MEGKKLKDVGNYSVDDLLKIVGLNKKINELTQEEIDERIEVLKQRFPNIAKTFLQKAYEKIMEEYDKLEEENEEDEEEEEDDGEDNYVINQNSKPKNLNDWWKNEYLTQDNPFENSKVTNRKHRVKVYDDKNGNHMAMKQETLGVVNAYNVPVVQGTLNPTLKNTTTQFMILDSQFRQNIAPYSNNTSAPSSSTDYTLDLSDPLTKVLSLKLYSYQIPYSWYTIDNTNGTACFWVKISGIIYTIQVPEGNYSAQNLINTISGILYTTIPGNSTGSIIDISYNSVNGKSFFYKTTPSTIIDVDIIFYISSIFQDCSGNACGGQLKLNYNLGYILGYRPISTDSDKEFPITFTRQLNSNNNYMVISESTVDTYGTRYLLIVIDDFNQNHLNKGLVSICDTNTTLSMPSYYSADLNYVCVNSPENPSSTIPVYIPSSPRNLTQNQLYSINQILENRNNTYKYRTSGPTTTDVFAVIPIRAKPAIGEPIVDYGSTLLFNTRTYFGPVNITRMRVSLQDTWGNTLNLHGNDWSISFIAELLYEF